MGTAVRVVGGTGGSNRGLLSRAGASTVEAQQAVRGDVSMSPDERLASIEAQLKHLVEVIGQFNGRMDRVNDRLESVARLEERWQSLDQRVGVLTASFEREMQRRSRIDDNMFDRVRLLETNTDMNSHGRALLEKLAIPLASALTGGMVLYTVQQIWGG